MQKTYIELHAHLDGCITAEIAKKLAAIQHMKLPTAGDEALKALLTVPRGCESLQSFLRCFAFPLTLLQTKEGIREAVYLVMENMKAQGVMYAELRFAPQYHTRKGLSQEEVVQAALAGLHRADIAGNLLLCCMRGSDNDAENAETLYLAKKYLTDNGGVTGMDLAGAEAQFPTNAYIPLFQKATEYKIPFTIHAGEADGAESVRAAAEMGAARIGHGVRMYADADTMHMIREKGILIEMCPTSNRVTRAIRDMQQYPLRAFLMQGIKATVCTDDMAILQTTLDGEYRCLQKTVGLDKKTELLLLQNAADGAFADQTTKNTLRNRIKRYAQQIE